MDTREKKAAQTSKGFWAWLKSLPEGIPLIGWLLGFFGAALIEYFLGDLISYYLGLPKVPADPVYRQIFSQARQ